jgi:hypothetical protein
MANQPELDQFDAGIYQLEKTDPVLAGLGGITNAPLVNIANRTRYLFNRIAEILGVSKNYVVAGGTTNAITAAYTPAVTATADGMELRFKLTTPNTNTVTFTPNAGPTNAIAPLPVVGYDLQPVGAGDMVGQCSVQLNTSLNSGNGAWVLTKSAGAPLSIAAGQHSNHAINLGQANAAYLAQTDAATLYLTKTAAAATYLTPAAAAATYTTPAQVAAAYLPLIGGTLTGSLAIPNNAGYQAKTTAGAAASIAYIDAANNATFGNNSLATVIAGSAVTLAAATSVNGAFSATSGTFTGNVSAANISATNGISAANATVNGPIVVPNNIGYQAKAVSGTAYTLMYMDASNNMNFGGALQTIIAGNPIVLSGPVNCTSSIRVPNNTAYTALTSGSGVLPLAYIDGANNVQIGNTSCPTVINSLGGVNVPAATTGGQAMNSSQSFSSPLQTYAGRSRALGTTYTNATGRAIWVNCNCSSNGAGSIGSFVGGLGETALSSATATGQAMALNTMVPPGQSYVIQATGTAPTLSTWNEYA